MPDNTQINPGVGGDVIRTDDIGGVKFPVSKLALGNDGVNDGLVSTTNPLPVVLPGNADLTPMYVELSRTARDLFGRIRVSEPHTVFDSKQLLSSQPLVWDDQETAGAGTSSSWTAPSTTIAVSNAVVGTRVRQTFRCLQYQPGKPDLIFLTGNFHAGAVGISKRYGKFDGAGGDGWFFQQVDDVMGVCIRSSITGDDVVVQSAWNLDRLDGSAGANNPSGYNVDWEKEHIFVISYQWLGAGDSYFGIVIGGRIVWCHVFQHFNQITVPYLACPNQPIRVEISNDGSGPSSSITHTCCTVISEGGREDIGDYRATDRGSTALTTLNDADIYPLIAVALNTRHGHVHAVDLSVVCTSTAAFRWILLMNPTVGTGLPFALATMTPQSDSVISVDVGRTSTTKLTAGTGQRVKSGYSLAQNESRVDVPVPERLLGMNIAGVPDFLVLAVQRITGTTESFYASLGWHESL